MRIVLVDASRVALKIVTGLLEARGHNVHSFRDGPEALKYLASYSTVDALMASAELPSMTGLELCWEARLLSTPRRPLYIILMSSNYDRHKLTEALDSGADDFIGKPVMAEELYARLRAAERLAATQHELFRLATTDPLSGVMNRRAFFEKGESICAPAHSVQPLCAIMLDIDHFKRVNDENGHGKGDEVICAVAKIASEASETVGRLGGEEFAILLEGSSLADAARSAELARVAIAGLRFETSAGPLKVTCSLGVSERKPGESLDLLLKRADAALYTAKQNGRNRVVTEATEVSSMTNETWSSVIRSNTRSLKSELCPHVGRGRDTAR